jgi:ornithine cyclodeaminase
MTVLISDEQVRKYVSMESCIDAVEEAFAKAGRGNFDVSERKVVSVASKARLMSLTAASEGFGHLVANIYSGAPTGVDKRTTTVNRRQKFYLLFDASTGACEAIVSGKHLAWLKTGAMGAVAIKHLSSPDARSLAIIGSGRQARSALIGALAVRDFKRIRVWSPSASNVSTFVSEFAHLPGIEPADSARDAVEPADVVITVSTSPEPVVSAEWLKKDCHINAIGAHYPRQRELDAATVATSTVFVDTLVAARAEKGELLLAEEEGAFSFDEVKAELGEIVDGRLDWQRSEGERTLFASSGSAIESMGAPLGALRAIPPDEQSHFDF